MPITTPHPDVARTRASQLTRGRKFSAGELQLQLLFFLRDAPAHGYELARRFDEVSSGFYSPSPGILYPALGQLQHDGFAQVEAAGRRKNYRITEAGLEHLQQNADQARSLIDVLKHAARKMLWIRQASESEAAASEATGWLPEFVQARKELRAALLAKDDARPDEQQRIIAILQRAATEILNEPEPDAGSSATT